MNPFFPAKAGSMKDLGLAAPILDQASPIQAYVTTSTEPLTRIPTLDGWRAVAILLVIVSHFNLQGLASVGQFGVSIFFSISGYLITTLLLRECAANGRISLSAFYSRRAWRLLPASWAYLGVLLVLGLAGPTRWVLGCFFFFSNYVPQLDQSRAAGHFWSLSMEEQFYFLWPPILAAAGKKRASAILWSAIAAVALWRPWAVTHPLQGLALSHRIDLRLDAFAIPCLLAIYLDWPANRERFRGLVPPSFGLLAGLLAGASVLSSSRSVIYFATAALLPLTVVSMVQSPHFPVSRILELPPVRWIGKISYSLYLWQQVFLLNTNWPFCMKLIAIVAAGSASHYFIEQPIRKFGAKLSARTRPRGRA
jgi:peptidoglycan/LPS O-acetylase OafA/YrhL